MSYQNMFDSHIHSSSSPKGSSTVMCFAEQAASKGFSGIAITDCCDISNFVTLQYSQRVRESVYSVYKARAAFANKLIISSGIELSQPTSDITLVNKILSKYSFDIVLGAVKTFPNGNSFHDFVISSPDSDTIIKALQSYYDYVLETVSWNGFDVLSHLSYPLVHLPLEMCSSIIDGRYDTTIEEILRTLAKNGKALEINVSGLRRECNTILPPVKYISMFKKLGGEFVTIGSGAHYLSTLGEGISEGMRAASSGGFTDFVFYKNRQPNLLKII